VDRVNPDILRTLLANAEEIAERARFQAELAAMPRKGGKVAGAGYRRGGVDRAYLAEMQRKADDAERAARDLAQMLAEVTR
jgi:hypothetical protein